MAQAVGYKVISPLSIVHPQWSLASLASYALGLSPLNFIFCTVTWRQLFENYQKF
jgi:hypothetical protein